MVLSIDTNKLQVQKATDVIETNQINGLMSCTYYEPKSRQVLALLTLCQSFYSLIDFPLGNNLANLKYAKCTLGYD